MSTTHISHRKTAIMLIIFALIGGTLISWKYINQQKVDRQETVKGRPFMMGKISKNLQTRAYPEQLFSFDKLLGKVWLCVVIDAQQVSSYQTTLHYLAKISQQYQNNPQVVIVCLLVNPIEQAVKIQQWLKKNDPKINFKQWKFLTAEPQNIANYAKNQLKLPPIWSKNERRWLISNKVRLIDQHMHIRGEFEHFDFDFAHKLANNAKKSLQQDPQALKVTAKDRTYFKELRNHRLQQPEHFYTLLTKNVNYILKEKYNRKKPNYARGFIITALLLTIIIILGIYARKKGIYAQK